jgi:hypothetical protein
VICDLKAAADNLPFANLGTASWFNKASLNSRWHPISTSIYHEEHGRNQ